MAFGYICKHCGRQESAHEGAHEETRSEMSERRPGRRYSLTKCPGYALSRENLRLERADVLEEVRRYGETTLTEWVLARHRDAIIKASGDR